MFSSRPDEGGRAFCSVSPARFAGSSFTCAKCPATLIWQRIGARDCERSHFAAAVVF
jgi:hypothetical protein